MIHATLNSPNSYLLLCPGCGDCWAKLAGTDQRFWWHRYVPCELCPEASFPYGGRLPGSLLEAENDLINCLTPDLLTREFMLTMSSIKEF